MDTDVHLRGICLGKGGFDLLALGPMAYVMATLSALLRRLLAQKTPGNSHRPAELDADTCGGHRPWSLDSIGCHRKVYIAHMGVCSALSPHLCKTSECRYRASEDA